MRYVNWAVGVAALSGTLALAAAPAGAQPTASMSGCVEMQNQVKTALAQNGQSPSYEDAVKQQRYGTEFCNSGFYQNGLAHYAEALKLLGVSQG